MPTIAMRRERSTGSDDARGAQRGDLGVGETELAQHLVRVLAERRREARDAGWRRRELHRRAERADPSAPRVILLDDRAVRLDLRMREDVGERVHATRRDVVRLEERDPLAAATRAEDVAQDGNDLVAVLHAQIVG